MHNTTEPDPAVPYVTTPVPAKMFDIDIGSSSAVLTSPYHAVPRHAVPRVCFACLSTPHRAQPSKPVYSRPDLSEDGRAIPDRTSPKPCAKCLEWWESCGYLAKVGLNCPSDDCAASGHLGAGNLVNALDQLYRKSETDRLLSPLNTF